MIFLVYLHAYLLRLKHGPSHDEKNSRNIALVSNNQLDSSDKGYGVKEGSDLSVGHNKENRSRSSSDVGELEEFHNPPPISYDSEGVNFYLRLGAIGRPRM